MDNTRVDYWEAMLDNIENNNLELTETNGYLPENIVDIINKRILFALKFYQMAI